MTTSTKVLSGTYTSGYSVQNSVTTLLIQGAAIVDGKQLGDAVYTAYGDTRSAALTVLNYGRLEGGQNVVTYANGAITETDGAPTSGIYLRSSAPISITNGSATATTAYIEGYGAGVNIGGAAATVTNFATIAAAFGPKTRQTKFLDDAAVMLLNGGAVTNGSAADTHAVLLAGYRGVIVSGAAGVVTNFGSIEMTNAMGESSYPGSKGVFLSNGGQVTNGSAADTAAIIRSGTGVYVSGGAGTVVNFGSVIGEEAGGLEVTDPGGGVALLSGGKVTNGSTNDFAALIEGVSDGVDATTGSVLNYGQIIGGSAAGSKAAGVRTTSGRVVNGAVKDARAKIEGYDGVVASLAASVVNYGGIIGRSVGLYMEAGGALTNGIGGVIAGTAAIIEGGSATISNAGAIDGLGGVTVNLDDGGTLTNANTGVIQGYDGIGCESSSTIHNYGQILTSGGYGVALRQGGTLTNGVVIGEAAEIHGADVYGSAPEVTANGAALVSNLSTIDAYGGLAVELTSESTLSNGSKYDNFAVIRGLTGVYLTGGSSAANFGTIIGPNGPAVSAADYSTITNKAGATISGFSGVHLASHSTLVEYGKIIGQAGIAVYVGLTDALVIGAGASFGGSITAAGGELSLGAGSASLVLRSGDTDVVSGLIATTTLTNFSTVDISSASMTTLSGTGEVASYDTLSVEGALSVAGKLELLTNSVDRGGQLVVTGALIGGGTLSVGAGAVATFAGDAVLGLHAVSLASAYARVNFTMPDLTFAGVWDQTAGTLDVASGAVLTFTGTGDTFRGTMTGDGRIDLTAGSDTLTNLTIDAFVTQTAGGKVTATGSITIGDQLSLQGGTFVVGSGTAGATFTGGTLVLGDASEVIGASGSSTLINLNSIMIGAGQLGAGRLRLVNDAAGDIVAESSSVALVINTGANVVINDGQIASYDPGGLVIESNIDNAGLLIADGGELTVEKNVSGAGSIMVDNATAYFEDLFTQNVKFGSENPFESISGELELAHSKSYTGTISGFSTTGTTSLDLLDIAFGSKTTASYSGTSSGGVLTVTSGVNAAHIKLSGNYTSSSFIVSSDGHGGTTIVDPAHASAATPVRPAAPLSQAIAGFGASRSASAPSPHRTQPGHEALWLAVASANK